MYYVVGDTAVVLYVHFFFHHISRMQPTWLQFGDDSGHIVYVIKIEIHFSCEIEYFVETHLCKLCVILRSRVLRVVCPR